VWIEVQESAVKNLAVALSLEPEMENFFSLQRNRNF
jgi:hypothetical protein